MLSLKDYSVKKYIELHVRLTDGNMYSMISQSELFSIYRSIAIVTRM